jgi:hypothetical protein
MRSPVEYFEAYQSLTIPSPDGSSDLATGISVDRYKLGWTQVANDERGRLARKIQKDHAILKQADPDAMIRVRVQTANGIEEHEFADLTFAETNQLWALVRYPYVGKGSPEAIQVALQLAAVELPGSPPFITPDAFQAYCDKWMGLDCNGFVGNFLRHERGAIAWDDVTIAKGIDPNQQIDGIWTAFGGTVRDHAADVDPDELNLMVLVDAAGKIIPGAKNAYGHIVITGPGETDVIDGKKAVCVVESTAAIEQGDTKNGLARSFYTMSDHPSLPGVITVKRGLNNKTMNVRIRGASWPPA